MGLIMGRRGPAPDPVPLKILKGRGNGRDSMGRPIPQVPKFNRGAPDPPPWLDPEAAALWARVAPSLERLDLIKDEDAESFATYCTAWSRFVAAVKTYQREGLTATNPSSGRISTHPAVHVAMAAGRDLLRYAQEFGLTPAAEIALARPAAPESDGDDPFRWKGTS
jgi:P27 family predicted phage terminase small subunit